MSCCGACGGQDTEKKNEQEKTVDQQGEKSGAKQEQQEAQ